jgi:hypothetical protein
MRPNPILSDDRHWLQINIGFYLKGVDNARLEANVVRVGLDRIVALYHRSSASYQIH